jgi:hypothetical protein
MINVELTTEEAELFKQFREYQDMFQLFLTHGLFNYQDGSIRLHYDHNSLVRKVEKWHLENI